VSSIDFSYTMNNLLNEEVVTEMLPKSRGQNFSMRNLDPEVETFQSSGSLITVEEICNCRNDVQVQTERKIAEENASEKLYHVEIFWDMWLGAEPDIILEKCCRAKDTKGHARISAVSRVLQKKGLKKGMYLIVIGIQNVTLSSYDRQMTIIDEYANAEKHRS